MTEPLGGLCVIDIVDSQRRSELMASIRGWDTAPECARNVERDKENEEALRSLGENVLVAWVRSSRSNLDLEKNRSCQGGSVEGSGARR